MIRCSQRNFILACALIMMGLGLIVMGHLIAVRSAEGASSSLALPQCRGCHDSPQVTANLTQRLSASQATPCDVCHESHAIVSGETEIRRRIVSVAANYQVRHDSYYKALVGTYWGYTLDHSTEKLAKAEVLLAYLQLKYPQYHWTVEVVRETTVVALTSVSSRLVIPTIWHQPITSLVAVEDPPLPPLVLMLMCLPLYLLYRQQRRGTPASDDFVAVQLNSFLQKIARIHPLGIWISLFFISGERITSPCYAD
jgi:hypothetical protein